MDKNNLIKQVEDFDALKPATINTKPSLCCSNIDDTNSDSSFAKKLAKIQTNPKTTSQTAAVGNVSANKPKSAVLNGVLNLYKPRGITSSTAVSKVRRILGVKCAGHMGTLDPAGEGVLIIGIGKAARLFDYFLKKDKHYTADFTFGYETDTLDGEGQVIKDGGTIPTLDQIAENIKNLVGKQNQMPPQYSAKSVNGVRAYDLARQGKTVELRPAPIEIYSAEVLAYNPPLAKVRIHCSSGTYIRSVCRDLAYLCGTIATMTAIKRTSSGAFTSEDAVSFEQLEQLKTEALLSVEDALKGLPALKLDEGFKKRLDHGIKINVDEIIGTPEVKALSNTADIMTGENGANVVCDVAGSEFILTGEFALFCEQLYGIARVENGKIVIKSYLKD